MLERRFRTSPLGRARCRTLNRALAPILLLLAVSAAPAPGAVVITDEMLEGAAARTGLSKEELVRRYQSGALPAPSLADSAYQPPGMTSPPPEDSTEIDEGAERPSGGRGRARQTEEGEEEGEEETHVGTDSISALLYETPAPLFGADFFKLERGVFTQSAFGPVPEDYVIGVGDQIVVDVWGDVEFRLERVVDRDGAIILPKGGKIHASGLTLGRLEQAVRARLAGSYSGISPHGDEGTTFLDVTLGKLRPIRVFVIGEAAQPGAYDLSSMATVFSALHAAGGPSSEGSMRDVRLVRGDQTLARFDVYDYLLKGDRRGDLILREYDTVLILPRGKTVELRGEVRRQLRFELKEEESLSDLLRFGGGFTASASSRVLHAQRIVPPPQQEPGRPDRVQVDLAMNPGRDQALDPAQNRLVDGDVVTVGRIGDRIENWVEISGPVKQPGRYEYREGMDVIELVEMAGRAWPERLAERALIERVAPDGTYESLHFSPGETLTGQGERVALRPRDRVRLFSIWEVQDRYSVSISGAVRRPGKTEYRRGMTLHDLILAAGGLIESADSVGAYVSRLRRDAAVSRDKEHPPDKTWDIIEVPLGRGFLGSAEGFPLEPHDAVLVRRLPWWNPRRSVTVSGEVLYPGVYTLQQTSQTLSEIIDLAGGLSPSAFAPGAFLTRVSQHIGRISIDLECALRHSDQSCNFVLEGGDSINIPPQPNIVRVGGAVGHPTNLVYETGRKPGYYVDRAGGYLPGADKWKTQVIDPNGTSRTIKRFWPDPSVRAGSTILVPAMRPKAPGNSLETLGKISAILASLATVYLVADRR